MSLTLNLASNTLHKSSLKCHDFQSKGTLIEFLSIIILAQPLMVSHGNESFPQDITTAMCKCIIITNLVDLNMEHFPNF